MKLRIGGRDEKHAPEILVGTRGDLKRIDSLSTKIIAEMYKMKSIEFRTQINVTIRDLMLAGF